MKGLKRFAALAAVVIMTLAMALPVSAESATARFVDTAGVMDAQQVSNLNSTLDSISYKHNVDVNLVTFSDMPEGYHDMEVLADQVYEQFRYGLGDNGDGLVLVLVINDHKWQISTQGYGIKAFTDAGIQYIGEQITPYLKDGDYYGAATKYAELADDFITKAKAGKPVDRGNMPRAPFGMVKALLISIGVGAIAAFIVVATLLAQLKSVRFQASADFYTKQGSLNLKNQRDTFLFTTVSRTERPKSSGGGSSTHTSSSGTTHGGGGGSW